MKLYRWRSDFFAGYYEGDIIVMAESLKEARVAVIKNYTAEYPKSNKGQIDALKLELKTWPAIYDKNEAIIIHGAD